MDIVHTNYARYLQLRPKIAEECEAFSSERLTALAGHDKDLHRRWEDGLAFVGAMVLKSGDFLASAVESMLSGMAIGAWTAFESLAGDLWVAAVNARPAG